MNIFAQFKRHSDFATKHIWK